MEKQVWYENKDEGVPYDNQQANSTFVPALLSE